MSPTLMAIGSFPCGQRETAIFLSVIEAKIESFGEHIAGPVEGGRETRPENGKSRTIIVRSFSLSFLSLDTASTIDFAWLWILFKELDPKGTRAVAS